MDNNMMMRRRISAYDFTIWELGIYLDTHPQDTRALNRRKQAQAERARLVAEYTSQFGEYITNSNDVTGDRWSWIDNPWPWDYVSDESTPV